MVPARSLVLLMLVPLALGVLTLIDRSLLMPMLATDAGILALAGLDALLSRKPKIIIRREAPNVLSLARPNRVRLLVRSSARRRLRAQLSDDLFADARASELPISIDLMPQASASLHYHVEPRRRGAYTLGDHWVRYPSPLGLWQRQLRIHAQDPVRVYPDVQAIRAFELLARRDREYAYLRATRLQGGESEFERLRDYTKDDEYRAIDWKATARRQKLIARQYQLERNQNLFFMLDGGRLMTAETEGLSHFDHALNAMLMLAHVASRAGDRVGMLAFDETMRRFAAPAGGPSAARRLIQSSYDLHPRMVEPDYDRAFGEVALRLRKRSLVVLFTQIIDDAAAQVVVQRTRALMGRHLTLLVLFRDVETDSILETPSSSATDLYERGAAAELVRWRGGVIHELKRAGALVLDVRPRELTPSLINRYLEIKARNLL